jgi:hypothetical protein
MRTRTHLISSIALGLALYPGRPLQSGVVAAAGTLVDLDHLLVYVFHTGDWSVVGALRYDAYRHRDQGWGDTRPRYGSMRSWLHRPELSLPLFWTLAARWAWLRPLTYGLSLHLLLDHYDAPLRMILELRARRICPHCGNPSRERLVVYRSRWRYQIACRSCIVQSLRARRGPHPAQDGLWYTDSIDGNGHLPAESQEAMNGR